MVKGGMHARGMCVVGSVHSGPACMAGACVERGGGCVAGETATAVDGTHTTGWYASYWNAFLLMVMNMNNVSS